MSGFVLQFANGTWLTVQTAVCALVIGLILGIAGATAKLSSSYALRFLAGFLTTVIRGIPELLVLFFVYFGGTLLLTALWGSYAEINAFIAGAFALGLLFAAYATEVLRGAVLAIPRGQFEAAQAFGFRPWQTFWYIMLPQTIRHGLPGLSNLWLVLLKDTALISLIGEADIMRVAQNITSLTRQPFTFYLSAAVLYLGLTTLSLIGQHYITKHYIGEARYG